MRKAHFIAKLFHIRQANISFSYPAFRASTSSATVMVLRTLYSSYRVSPLSARKTSWMAGYNIYTRQSFFHINNVTKTS